MPPRLYFSLGSLKRYKLLYKRVVTLPLFFWECLTFTYNTLNGVLPTVSIHSVQTVFFIPYPDKYVVLRSFSPRTVTVFPLFALLCSYFLNFLSFFFSSPFSSSWGFILLYLTLFFFLLLFTLVFASFFLSPSCFLVRSVIIPFCTVHSVYPTF